MVNSFRIILISHFDIALNSPPTTFTFIIPFDPQQAGEICKWGQRLGSKKLSDFLKYTR